METDGFGMIEIIVETEEGTQIRIDFTGFRSSSGENYIYIHMNIVWVCYLDICKCGVWPRHV